MPKKQFKGGGKPRTFFERKVRVEGHSRVVAMGKVIPENWAYVRIEILSKTKTKRTISITKLLGVDQLAQLKNTDTPNRQDT